MGEPWVWAVAVVAAVNLLALLQMAWDKRCARVGARRIPEARLILPVVGGGLPGILLGMALFRHKTRKRRFQLALASVALVWAVAVLWIVRAVLKEGA